MTSIKEQKYLDNLTYQVDFEISKEDYQGTKDKTIDELIKGVEVDGFRKGKAPKDVALAKINHNFLAQKLMQQLLIEYMPKAEEEAEIMLLKDDRRILSRDIDYDIENTAELDDGGFKIRIIYKLFPKIDLSGIDKIKYEKATASDVAPEGELEKFIQSEESKIIEQFSEFEEVQVASKNGDKVIVKMSGEAEGKAHPGMQADNFEITLGAGGFIPGFEENILGMREGDNKTFDVKFPENYSPELAGKDAKFTIDVKSVNRPKISDLAELIKNNEQLAKNYKSVEDFKESTKGVYNSRLEGSVENINRSRVVQAVVDEIKDFDMDEVGIKNETDRIFESLKKDAEDNDKSINEVLIGARISQLKDDRIKKLKDDEIKDEVKKYVTREFKLSSILTYIYTFEIEDKIKPEEFSNVFEQAKTNKQMYGLEANLTDEEVERILMDRMYRNKAGDWIYSKVK